jgi:hypothetical protein
MLDFFIDNIFVQFGGQVFQPTIGIPMGKNFASLLADLFLHPYETNFLQGILKNIFAVKKKFIKVNKPHDLSDCENILPQGIVPI